MYFRTAQSRGRKSRNPGSDCIILETLRAQRRETKMGSNKPARLRVQLFYRTEHWLTKAKENYERNKTNIGGDLWPRLSDKLCPDQQHHDHDARRYHGDNHNRCGDDVEHWNDRDLYAGFGLHQIGRASCRERV